MSSATPIPAGAPSVSVFLVLRSSSTRVPNTPATKPWYRISDVFPAKGVAAPKDPANHRYVSVQVVREGATCDEAWIVKLEFRNVATEDVRTVSAEKTPDEAAERLAQQVSIHTSSVAPIVVTQSYTYDADHRVKACRYVMPSSAPTNYYWDVVQEELAPLKRYGLAERWGDGEEGEEERERWDLEWREKEGLEMARRTREEDGEGDVMEQAEEGEVDIMREG